MFSCISILCLYMILVLQFAKIRNIFSEFKLNIMIFSEFAERRETGLWRVLQVVSILLWVLEKIFWSWEEKWFSRDGRKCINIFFAWYIYFYWIYICFDFCLESKKWKFFQSILHIYIYIFIDKFRCIFCISSAYINEKLYDVFDPWLGIQGWC